MVLVIFCNGNFYNKNDPVELLPAVLLTIRLMLTCHLLAKCGSKDSARDSGHTICNIHLLPEYGLGFTQPPLPPQMFLMNICHVYFYCLVIPSQ